MKKTVKSSETALINMATTRIDFTANRDLILCMTVEKNMGFNSSWFTI